MRGIVRQLKNLPKKDIWLFIQPLIKEDVLIAAQFYLYNATSVHTNVDVMLQQKRRDYFTTHVLAQPFNLVHMYDYKLAEWRFPSKLICYFSISEASTVQFSYHLTKQWLQSWMTSAVKAIPLWKLICSDLSELSVYEKTSPLLLAAASLSINDKVLRKYKPQPLYTSAAHTIDLHIEKLIQEDTTTWRNHEIVHFQLQTLQKAINKACMKGGALSLTIIHGVGNGTLRNAVYEFLRSQGYSDVMDCRDPGSTRVSL